jgi:hypothetical protein
VKTINRSPWSRLSPAKITALRSRDQREWSIQTIFTDPDVRGSANSDAVQNRDRQGATNSNSGAKAGSEFRPTL